jgi:hypothetical protein
MAVSVVKCGIFFSPLSQEKEALRVAKRREMEEAKAVKKVMPPGLEICTYAHPELTTRPH